MRLLLTSSGDRHPGCLETCDLERQLGIPGIPTLKETLKILKGS